MSVYFVYVVYSVHIHNYDEIGDPITNMFADRIASMFTSMDTNMLTFHGVQKIVAPPRRADARLAANAPRPFVNMFKNVLVRILTNLLVSMSANMDAIQTVRQYHGARIYNIYKYIKIKKQTNSQSN